MSKDKDIKYPGLVAGKVPSIVKEAVLTYAAEKEWSESQVIRRIVERNPEIQRIVRTLKQSKSPATAV